MEHLRAHLKGKVIMLGIGSSMRRDDAAGSMLAARLAGKLDFKVFDAGPAPENYLGKIISEKPDNVIVVDAVDFGGGAGEYRILEVADAQTVNLFSTHNASIPMVSGYLQKNLTADIIILAIQPKSVSFGEALSPEVSAALSELEEWFYGAIKKEG
ncbi:MAG: hydrogenase 3 maturation endopeptidase HyCI [Candidatus Omnitrophota bacterium]